MLTKEELFASIRHETETIKHLAKQVPADKMDWRPTPGQRSNLELLQYMTVMSSIPATNINTANWDHAEEMSKEAASVTQDSFGDAMDRQLAHIGELFAGWDEATLRTADHTQPWGVPIKKSQASVDMILKAMVAYRMQLFLYAKQSGNAELSTYDCWVGMSAPSKPQ